MNSEGDKLQEKPKKKRIGFYARLTPTLERQLKVVLKKSGKRGPQDYVRDMIKRDFAELSATHSGQTAT